MKITVSRTSKSIFLVIFTSLIFLLKPQTTLALTSGDYQYTVDSGGNAEITKYTGSAGSVTIPSTVDGHTVTSLGQAAFSDIDTLTDVTIPDSVTKIGRQAFYFNHNLISVTIGKGVNFIGDEAFQSCLSMRQINVSFENSSYYSQDGVLYNKPITTLLIYPPDKSDTSLVIPSMVTTIGPAAARYSSNLRGVYIPNGVVTIGRDAFRECSGLTSIKIPGSVTEIGDNAFNTCNNLTEARFYGNAPVMGGNVFYGCGLGYRASGFKVWHLADKTGFTNPWYGYPTEAFLSYTPLRYGGIDRFETAAKISQAGWTTCDNVVLVNGLEFADALAGVPFAYLKDAPVLLTYASSLPAFTSNEITRLSAKNIYILGGTGAVSVSVENALKAKGLNVYRYSGLNRFETAAAVAGKVSDASSGNTAVITTAYNYPDALSISPYAAISKYPILFTYSTTLNETTRNFLVEKGIKSVIIPGMYGAVSADVEAQLKNMGINVQRVGGDDRYLTSCSIAQTFRISFRDDVMISNGENFPDALAGGVLAAKKGVPVLLVYKDYIIPESSRFLCSRAGNYLYITGGTGVISDSLINRIRY